MSIEQNKLEQEVLQTLFVQARTHSFWQEKAVTQAQIEEIYALLKMAPTSANCSPGRFLFIITDEAKAQLKPALSSGNIDKTLTAPVTVVVAYDADFYQKLPELFPYADARSWFTSSPELAQETAFRNSSLQAAYLILACRSLGLDAGPMSGFNAALVDETFFAGSTWKANLLINIGYGVSEKLHPRLPRLAFDDACKII